MKGPPRPHNMQTIGPPLTRPEGGSSAATAAEVADGSGESDSGKVGTQTWAGED